MILEPAGNPHFPLTGLIVLDLTDEPVALAPRLLGDLGAEVIRIESSSGDELRRAAPFVHDEPGLERSLLHLLLNAGKYSVAADLASTSCWDIAARIAAQADVVIAPLSRSPLARAFFEASNFEQAAPGVGLVDPVFRREEEHEVTDLVGLAAGGQLYLNGFPEDPPNHAAGNLAYKQLALASSLAAMSLVLEKAAGRVPGRIQVSMQEAVMWTTIQTANENYWHWHKTIPARRGITNVGGQTIYQAVDGQYLSLYHHPPAFAAFARWYAELFDDDTYTRAPWDDDVYRFSHAAEVVRITQRVCSSMARDLIVAEGQKRGILAVPVQGVAEIAADPHLRERRFFQRTRIAQLGEDLELLRAPFVSSRYTAEAKPPPALGEHSREVLERFGFSEAEIDELEALGAVMAPRREVPA